MRLYLSSSDLGKFADTLIRMVGDNKKVLVISNARDHRMPEDRKVIVEKFLGKINNVGLIATELDLRNYFGKPTELREYINSFNPGLIFAMGGNVYSLATAMRLSGMDEVLREDLKEDKYVYGGYSAGAMVASSDLLSYLDSFGRRIDDRLDQTKGLYGEAFTDGLGLIEEYVVPHADEEEFKEACAEAKASLQSKGLTPIILNDPDVVIVDNGETEIKRYE